MPALRKVDPTEAANWLKGTSGNKGARKAVHAEYDDLIKDYVAGDTLRADLTENEKALAVKAQIKGAAARRGLAVDFKRGKKNLVIATFVEKPDTAE